MTLMNHLIGGVAALSLVACSADSEGEQKPSVDTPTTEAASVAEPSIQDKIVIKPGPGPALWKASDEDTQIFLFGTVHVLPPELEWRTPVLEGALKSADTFYFEADLDGEEQKLAMLVAQLGTMPPGQSLFDLLTTEEKAELIAAAEEIKLPIASLSSLRPWFAGITIALIQIIAQGHDPESGVENILLPEARAAGKQLRFFETAEEQLRFMADLPDAVQVEFLMEGVRQINDIPDFLDFMDEAWVNGDVDALAKLMLEDASFADSIVYDAMLLNRNLNWADELAKLAKEEAGVFMVAVGAAHLAGEDSVVLMLEKGGLTVERVQ